MATRVLVTGSAGVIGPYVVCELQRVGFAVCGLDVAGQGEDCGDVLDPEALERRADGCGGIVHLAGESVPARAELDPERAHRLNVEATRDVARQAERLSAWMILASSFAVYRRRSEPDEAVEESERPDPAGVYARSKVAAEASLEPLDRACSVRLASVYGSPADISSRVVPTLLRRAMAGEVVEASPRVVLDFIHVEDVARFMVRVALGYEARRTIPRVLNCATGIATPLSEVASACMAAAGTGSVHAVGQAARWFAGSNALAAEAVGWRPRVALAQGIYRLVTDRRQYGRDTREHATVCRV